MPIYLGRKFADYSSNTKLEKQSNGFAILKQTRETCHLVLGDSLDDDEADIIAAVGVPQIGAAFGSTFCVEHKAQEIDRAIHPETGDPVGLWEITCVFDSDYNDDQANNGGNGSNGDPTRMRPKRRWYCEKVTERQERNSEDGTLIQTTAGEPIFITDDVSHAILEVRRYEQYPFDPGFMYQYIDTTNLDAFYGAPPGCALIDDITSDEVEIDGKDYIENVYTIRFRTQNPPGQPDIVLPDGWYIKVPNRGFLYRPARLSNDGVTVIGYSDPVVYLDANGHPKQILLNADGGKLGDDEEPIEITVQRKIKIDFAPLNLEY